MSIKWTKTRIIAAITGSSKGEVLQELVEIAIDALPGLDRQTVLQALWEREKLATTGRGNGVAIPHAVLGGLTQVELFFCRSMQGVAFDALDGRPVHCIFLVLAPEQPPESYLSFLGRIARFAGMPVIRTRLMHAVNEVELQEILADM